MRLPHLLLLVLALAVAGRSFAGAPTPSAPAAVLLPLDAPGLLPTIRDDVEHELRSALVEKGLVLQPADATAAILADAVSGGLSCSVSEVSCGLRIGAIADTHQVLLASIDAGALMITLVDVTDKRASLLVVGAANPPQKDAGASIRAVVARVLSPPATLELVATAGARVVVDGLRVGDAPLVAPLALAAGPHSISVDEAGFIPSVKVMTLSQKAHERVVVGLEHLPTEGESGPGLLVAGGVTAGAGALIALGCGAGALGIEADLDQPKPGHNPPDTGLLGVGRDLLVGSAAGIIAALVGGSLLVVALAE